jgi:hypothetical protein
MTRSSYDSTAAATHAEAMAVEKRLARESNDRALAEFLARGGTIQQIDPFVSGRVAGESISAWGKPKKRSGEAPILEVDVDDIVS